MQLLPLETVSLKKVTMLNSIVGKRRSANFNFDDNRCVFKFTIPSVKYKQHFFFKIKLSDHLIWVCLDRLPDPSFFSKEFKDIDLQKLPDAVKPVVFEAAMDKVFSQIEKALGVVLSLEEFVEAMPEHLPSESLTFAFKSQTSGQVFRGTIHMELPAIQFLAALIERQRPVLTNKFNALRVPVRLGIGELIISAKEYAGIRENDIILFDALKYVDSGDCIARFGRNYSFNAKFTEGTVTLGTIMDEEMAENMPKDLDAELGEDTMAAASDHEGLEDESESHIHTHSVAPSAQHKEPQDASTDGEDFEEEANEGAHPLSNLPVRLVFEVGRRTIPLDELKSLQEGFVFELMNPPSKPVTIRANGQIIGSGELLQIGDRVGVRVAKFNKQ